MMWDSGMEYEMFRDENKKFCERCGDEVSHSGDCGIEWDMNVCCYSCADELAYRDELKEQETE